MISAYQQPHKICQGGGGGEWSVTWYCEAKRFFKRKSTYQVHILKGDAYPAVLRVLDKDFWRSQVQSIWPGPLVTPHPIPEWGWKVFPAYTIGKIEYLNENESWLTPSNAIFLTSPWPLFMGPTKRSAWRKLGLPEIFNILFHSTRNISLPL